MSYVWAAVSSHFQVQVGGLEAEGEAAIAYIRGAEAAACESSSSKAILDGIEVECVRIKWTKQNDNELLAKMISGWMYYVLKL